MHKQYTFTHLPAGQVQRILSLLLVLAVLSTLTGCSGRLVPAGEDGIPVKAGGWAGSDDAGQFSLVFELGASGENILVQSFSYPCGRQTAFALPPRPMKASLQDSAFTLTTKDISDLLPTLIVTGTFTDSTHVEGTWDFGGEQVTPDLGCPPASGTWQGGPQ